MTDVRKSVWVGNAHTMWVHGNILLHTHLRVMGTVTEDGGVVVSDGCRLDLRQVRKDLMRLVKEGVDVQMSDKVRAVLEAHHCGG